MEVAAYFHNKAQSVTCIGSGEPYQKVFGPAVGKALRNVGTLCFAIGISVSCNCCIAVLKGQYSLLCYRISVSFNCCITILKAQCSSLREPHSHLSMISAFLKR